MGYIFELRGGRVADVVASLERGFPGNGDIGEVVAAAARGEEEVTAVAGAALHVVDVIRQNSHWWSAIQHTSSGGGDFRSSLTDTVAPHLGRDFTVNLVSRPIAGITSDDHPLFGWVTNEEASRAIARTRARGLPAAEEQSDELRVIVRMVEAAVERGVDLLTVYV